jgi:aryl-alcohol dehydrogenase-like predicted oxidoreductase
MKTVKLPGNNKSLSQIIMGTMIIGLHNYQESTELLDNAMKLGINSFDLAYVYGGGDSERAVGKWMEEHSNREQVFIATKGAHPDSKGSKVNPAGITADLTESLNRLRTDYIDAYLLHRDDINQPVSSIIDILNEHYNTGKIRAFGGSNWTHERISEANAYAIANGLIPMTVSSPNYGLCEQVEDPWGPGCVTISGKIGKAGREFYKNNNMPVLAYSSLGRGMLSGRVTRENYKEMLDGAALKAYAHEINFTRLDRARELAGQKGVSVPQIALAYLLHQPLKVFPIVGAAGLKELEETVAAADIILTEQECAWLENS